MWFLSSLFCFLVLALGVVSASPVALFPPRGGARGKDTVQDGPLTLFTKTVKEARRHLAAAGVARSISIFAMYPVDTIKTRMQMEQANAMRMAGLYNGVGGSLLGQVPYG